MAEFALPFARAMGELASALSCFLAFCSLAAFATATEKWMFQCHPENVGSFYDFTTGDIYGTSVSLAKFRNQVSLVVNVATFWGLTSQYLDLNALAQKLTRGDCGLTVLGFPCNQFGKQEPGANAQEIFNGLKFVRPGENFTPLFPLFKKRDVNGKDEDELFTWLKVTT